MTQHTHPHRFAGAAIAAVLALGSTPVWAQETAPAAAPPTQPTQPTIVLPPVSAAPAPAAPAIVLPIPEPVAAAPVAAAPVVERAAPRAAAPVARAVPTRAVEPVVRAAAAPIEPVAAAPVDAPIANVAPIEPFAADETPVTEPVAETATAAPADSTTGDILPIAGILAALGLGGIALFASRRRRRQPDEVAPVIVAHQPAPVLPPRATVTATKMPAPDFVAPALSLQQFAQSAPVPTANTAMPRPAWQEPRRAGTVPASAQASQLNRQALLERMVAATPDANNPFTSGKARRHRARLMLQSMDNNRWDDADLAPGFDWREQARATRQLETVSS